MAVRSSAFWDNGNWQDVRSRKIPMEMFNAPIQESAFTIPSVKVLYPERQQSQIQQQLQSQQSVDPIDIAVDRQKQKGLKYSMKRGKGCTDCSAFTRDVFKDAYGIDIGDYTGTQQFVGQTVTDGNYKNGDLIFTSPDNGKRTGGISHVGIYKDGDVIDFTSSGGGKVRRVPMSNYYKPWKVQRVLV